MKNVQNLIISANTLVNEVGTHVFCSIRYCNDEYFLKFHEIDRLILYKYKKYKLIQ